MICATIRSRRGSRCNHCRVDTATRDILVGSIFQDRRQPGHQDAAASQPSATSQSIPQGDPVGDSPLPNCPVQDIVLTEQDKQLLADLRRASALPTPRCIVSRHATAWAESLEGAISGHQSWAVLLHAEIPKGSDRNTELKHRLQLCETGETHELVGRILGQ